MRECINRHVAEFWSHIYRIVDGNSNGDGGWGGDIYCGERDGCDGNKLLSRPTL